MPADITWEELDEITFYSQTLAAPDTIKKLILMYLELVSRCLMNLNVPVVI